jgi:hypothetical protein
MPRTPHYSDLLRVTAPRTGTARQRRNEASQRREGMAVDRPKIDRLCRAAGRTAHPQEPMPCLERAADRRREQHRHALGLPFIPRCRAAAAEEEAAAKRATEAQILEDAGRLIDGDSGIRLTNTTWSDPIPALKEFLVATHIRARIRPAPISTITNPNPGCDSRHCRGRTGEFEPEGCRGSVGRPQNAPAAICAGFSKCGHSEDTFHVRKVQYF